MNKKILTLFVLVIALASGGSVSASETSWWDSDYEFRQQITIQNNAGVVMESEYTVEVAFDVAGKTQANGDDIRVVYNGIELDRLVDTGAGTVTFATQVEIVAEGGDSNYHIYYGNSNANSPPEDATNIYLDFEDFEDGDVSGWSLSGGDQTIEVDSETAAEGIYSLSHSTPSGINMHKQAYKSVNIGDQDAVIDLWMRTDQVTGPNLELFLEQNEASFTDAIEIYFRYSGKITYYDGSVHTIVDSYSANTWYRFRIVFHQGSPDSTFDVYVYDSTGSLLGSVIGASTRGIVTEINYLSLMIDVGSGTHWVDTIKISKYIDVEPMTSTGPEEEQDSDNDGIPNNEDNCQFVPNTDQADNDADGAGDVCDPDDDNDDVADEADNCQFVANTDQADNDADGAGDVCDPDDDNDDVADEADNCQFVANTDQANFDGDAFGDACDADADDDGVPDDTDACLWTPLGSIINTDGCSIAQLCPADADYKNHGKYVSCVSHTTNAFKRAGLITGKEKGAIVSEAAKSDVGKKK